MPLYEYQCDDCGARLERIQKFSDPPLDRCPTCNGTLRKLVSSPAIQFKGSGWYITDYARKPEASSKSDSDKSEKKAEKTEGASAPAASADSAGASSSTSSSSDSAPKTSAKG